MEERGMKAGGAGREEMAGPPPPPPPVECDGEGMKVYIHDPVCNGDAWGRIERFSAAVAAAVFILMIAMGMNGMSMDGGRLATAPAATGTCGGRPAINTDAGRVAEWSNALPC